MDRNVLVTLVFVAAIFSMVSFMLQMLLLNDIGIDDFRQKMTARISNDGLVSLCINTQPEISVPCSTNVSQDQSFSCQLNLSDGDGHNVTVTSNATLFNVTSSGEINFTPGNDDVGNHTVLFTANDSLGCSNSIATLTETFEVLNINDPPFLVQNIPDQEFQEGTELSAFFLDDYFSDPDGDDLSYTSSDPDGVTVNILSSSEVRFTAPSCGVSPVLVTFTASDPFNATADSNAVEITITCEQAPGDGAGDDSSGGGGGGGVGACESEWECQDWFACLPNGLQWRRCYDRNGCESDRYLKRLCEYEGERPVCEENWLCSAWGQCHLNETQYRTCEDLNECGTEIFKPSTQQACIYIATCHDGIQNGNETGVDCGGECPACALVQKPSPIEGSGGLQPWMILLLLLILLVTGTAARYYREEIAQFTARLGFMLRHRTYKEVLLDAAARKSLFERISSFERSLDPENPDEMYERLAMLIRQYVHESLGLPVETLPEEVQERCSSLGLSNDTTGFITGLFGKVEVLETEKLEYDHYFMLATTEELRTLVCLTSDYQLSEMERALDELTVSDEMSFYDELYVRMTNVLRAVQFDQFDAAKKEYVKLISRYDPLAEEEKEQIYPDLQWTFRATRFLSDVTGSRTVST